MNKIQSQDNLWNPVTENKTKAPFLGWLSTIGTGLLSAFEQGESGGGGYYEEEPTEYRRRPYPTDDTPPFNPSKEPIPECCSLWYNINQDPSKMCHYPNDNVPAYTCPPGFQQEYWTCVEGTRVAACAECAAGDNCWSGPWQCSIWWWVS
jgi:hypothetical protein